MLQSPTLIASGAELLTAEEFITIFIRFEVILLSAVDVCIPEKVGYHWIVMAVTLLVKTSNLTVVISVEIVKPMELFFIHYFSWLI